MNSSATFDRRLDGWPRRRSPVRNTFLSSVRASSCASTVSEEQEIHDQVDDRTGDRVDRQPLLPTPATVPGALPHRRHLLRLGGGPFHPHRVLRAACPLRACVVRHVPHVGAERGRVRETVLSRAWWWALRDSNPRPSPCKGDALPAELSARACGCRVT